MAKIKRHTMFEFGFKIKGTDNDLVGIYSAPESWEDVYSGTPIQIDAGTPGFLKVCPDGGTPHGYLYSRVSEDLTILEWTHGIDRDEVRPGDAVSYFIPGQGKIMKTDLLDTGYTAPAVGDELAVKNGAFAEATEGDNVIGEVTEVDGDYIRIVLAHSSMKDADTEVTEKLSITAPADGTEQDTGWTIPANAIVKDIKLKVNTAEVTGTTETIDIGTDSTSGGDADGFLVGADVSATGIVKGTLASGGQTLGALLYADEDGAGALVPEDDIASGGTNVTFTAGSADFAELDADIYITYKLLN